MNLRPHIEKFRKRFAEVETALSDPKVFDNPQNAQELSREYARLKELVAQGDAAYLKTLADLEENRALLKSRTGGIRTGVNWPGRKSPGSKRTKKTRAANPVRPGAAGPDGFAQHHHRNPRRRGRLGIRAVRRRSLPDVLPLRRSARLEGRDAGFQPVRPGRLQGNRFQITGADVYKRLKYESGVHRVQRVPATEAQGASTPAPAPSRCCPRPRKWTSKSSPTKSKSTSAAPPARAARA
jgi:peptide chain release factor 1